MLTYVITNVGLILLVTCYCLVGGAIFEDLERQNEIQVLNTQFPKVMTVF